MHDDMNQEPKQSQEPKEKKITVEDLKKIKGGRASWAAEIESGEDIKWKILETLSLL
jgi:hypothetical protein